MKVCPQCRTQFDNNLSFCLNDGFTLIDSNSLDAEKTLSFSEKPTIEAQNPFTGGQHNKQTMPMTYQSYPPPRSSGVSPAIVFGSVLGVILLLLGGVVGLAFYLKDVIRTAVPTPTPRINVTPYSTPTPYRTPTPAPKPELKIEEAGKINGKFGQKFLKYMVTNPTDKIVITPNITVTLYDKDVKLSTLRGESKLKYLKPGQTVPVWVDLFFGSDKFTEAKTATSTDAKFAAKTEEQLFPQLTVTDTKMVVTRENSMFNNYTYSENWYTVSGVIENTNYDKISPSVTVIFYDENSNIVGIDERTVGEVKRGEKQKFSVGAGETSSLFGKVKKFEIMVTDGRSFLYGQ